MAKYPADMTPEEFFTLPEARIGEYGLQPLRRRDDPTGFIDEEGYAWRWIQRDDGSYARERLG